MEKSILLETIGNTVENRIIDFLIAGFGIDYSITDIAKAGNISRPTVYKVLPELLASGVVISERSLGKITLYKINMQNERVKNLWRLQKQILEDSSDSVMKKPVAINH